MVKIFFLLLYVLSVNFTAVRSSFFPFIYPRLKHVFNSHKNSGKPLMLTPLLKKGAIDLAQKLSQVSITDTMGFPSHAGFFTVDEDYNSNMYFWYFPPFNKKPNAPVVLWLQGGPGGSSLFGLFTELGPLIVTTEGFALRKYHWALNYHLIFVDNPVGTGFSFTESEDGYCKNEKDVAKGLYNTLTQFFMLFPKLAQNEFYITGESYAGKYIPALGMEIHEQNKARNMPINLQGMAIGNGYCDPVNQLDYGNFLYQHGLIDDNELNVFLSLQSEIVKEIKNNNWVKADLLMDQLLDGEIGNFSYFKNYTGFTNYYNFLQSADPLDMSVFTDILNNDKLRRSIHVGNLTFDTGDKVRLYLAKDILKSVAPVISELLSHYRMLFYNGQLDIIVAYPLTENFLRNLHFSASQKYEKAPRSIWRVGSDVAGYIKKAGNLTEVLVRNAGHMVPADQPKWALDLITRFIRNTL